MGLRHITCMDGLQHWTPMLLGRSLRTGLPSQKFSLTCTWWLVSLHPTRHHRTWSFIITVPAVTMIKSHKHGLDNMFNATWGCFNFALKRALLIFTQHCSPFIEKRFKAWQEWLRQRAHKWVEQAWPIVFQARRMGWASWLHEHHTGMVCEVLREECGRPSIDAQSCAVPRQAMDPWANQEQASAYWAGEWRRRQRKCWRQWRAIWPPRTSEQVVCQGSWWCFQAVRIRFRRQEAEWCSVAWSGRRCYVWDRCLRGWSWSILP